LYELHRHPCDPAKYRFGSYPSLAAAMDAPLHLPDPYYGGGPGDWIAAAGIPGKIYAAPETYLPASDGDGDEIPGPTWSIEAPGVARELATQMTTAQLAGRGWTTSDSQCLAAAAQLRRHLTTRLAGPEAGMLIGAIGARLAAWYATSDAPPGGMFLTSADLDQVVRLAVAAAGDCIDLTVPPGLAVSAVLHGLRITPDPDPARS